MLNVLYMQPFYTKVSNHTLRLVFAYRYFLIEHNGESFHFIPIEDKEIRINLHTLQVENLDSVFVFQCGNRYIRLPIRELLMMQNINDYLTPIISKEENNFKRVKQRINPKKVDMDKVTRQEIHRMIAQLEYENVLRLIDEALDNGNRVEFERLVGKLNEVKEHALDLEIVIQKKEERIEGEFVDES